jgi:hypothetical protein
MMVEDIENGLPPGYSVLKMLSKPGMLPVVFYCVAPSQQHVLVKLYNDEAMHRLDLKIHRKMVHKVVERSSKRFSCTHF